MSWLYELKKVGVARSDAIFMPIERTDNVFWALAISGEAGEVNNEIKKWYRGDYVDRIDQGTLAIGRELADVMMYCSLMASKLGIDLPEPRRIDSVGIRLQGLRLMKSVGLLCDYTEQMFDIPEQGMSVFIKCWIEPELVSIINSLATIAFEIEVDLEQVVRAKFNEVSQRHGVPHRM